MTPKEKQLLIKDLCARLPYNLYIRVEEFNVPKNDGRITEGFIGNYLKDNRCNDYDTEGILNELADGLIDVKPYLRPMSSMTEEEKLEYFTVTRIQWNENDEPYRELTIEAIDWLLEHHFDYRGLIPMGLAIEAPEGMYKIK